MFSLVDWLMANLSPKLSTFSATSLCVSLSERRMHALMLHHRSGGHSIAAVLPLEEPSHDIDHIPLTVVALSPHKWKLAVSSVLNTLLLRLAHCSVPNALNTSSLLTIMAALGASFKYMLKWP